MRNQLLEYPTFGYSQNISILTLSFYLCFMVGDSKFSWELNLGFHVRVLKRCMCCRYWPKGPFAAKVKWPISDTILISAQRQKANKAKESFETLLCVSWKAQSTGKGKTETVKERKEKKREEDDRRSVLFYRAAWRLTENMWFGEIKAWCQNHSLFEGRSGLRSQVWDRGRGGRGDTRQHGWGWTPGASLPPAVIHPAASRQVTLSPCLLSAESKRDDPPLPTKMHNLIPLEAFILSRMA